MRRLFGTWKLLLLPLLLTACGMGLRGCTPAPVDDATLQEIYRVPPPPAAGSLTVYHLGHSLVGQDMPAMLRQLAGAGHAFHSQLGWGANLREHWEPDIEVKGFEDSNGHPEYREPHEAMASGDYDAVVLTEALPIRSAIKYHDPHEYLRKWSVAAWEANPESRIYFYESWHSLEREDWLNLLDNDLGLYWEGEILRRALAYGDVTRPIYMIPGGQVMAAFTRAVEGAGGVGPIRDRQSLFYDDIHFNDYGAYLMALTHYAVLYGRSPVGLPHALLKADGTAADDPGPEVARLMQETVWQVVTGYPLTGVAQD